MTKKSYLTNNIDWNLSELVNPNNKAYSDKEQTIRVALNTLIFNASFPGSVNKAKRSERRAMVGNHAHLSTKELALVAVKQVNLLAYNHCVALAGLRNETDKLKKLQQEKFDF